MPTLPCYKDYLTMESISLVAMHFGKVTGISGLKVDRSAEADRGEVCLPHEARDGHAQLLIGRGEYH